MKISNPLTVIAVFAGVAEAFATVALINLPQEMQGIFIYFVMAFPAAIVGIFFLVLIFRTHVLYAPSDYDDQEHFLVANRLKQSIDQEAEKLFIRLNERNQPISKNEINILKSQLSDSVIKSLSSRFENDVVEYLRSNSREAFTDRALGHILAASRRSVREILESLEKRNLVVRGIEQETGTVLWQAKT